MNKLDLSSKSMVPEPRKSNIELLRILAIIGVIVLHYNNRDAGGGFKYVTLNSANEWLLRILESLFICAVDVFILITGYFMCRANKRSLIKPLQLIVQVMAFSIAVYLLQVTIGIREFSLKSLAGAAIPANYFVVLYMTLYLISPYLNLIMEKLSKHSKRQAIIILFLLFSVQPFLVDIFTVLSGRELMGLSTIGAWGSQWGYTIVNFSLLYIIGAYIHMNHVMDAVHKAWPLIMGLCGIVVILAIWSKFNEDTAWEYCSPLVIAEAIIIFLLFFRLPIGINKFINGLAKASFSVYLLHGYFLPYVNIHKFVQGNIFILGGGILITTIGIYLVCWIVYWFYQKVTYPIFRLMSKKITLSIDLETEKDT